MRLVPQDLTTNAEVVDRLGWTFDLRVGTDPDEPLWFSVDGVEEIRPIARDSTGGVVALLAATSRVLYVTSEGAAGIVAADLDEFIGLVATCPYWQDLLKFSGNGKLDEMRRAAAVLEAGYVDDEALDEARALLKSELGLAEPADPVRSLHGAVSSSDVIVRGLDGSALGSLFNSFIIDEDRMRRLFGG
jgi:hypothetical protein